MFKRLAVLSLLLFFISGCAEDNGESFTGEVISVEGSNQLIVRPDEEEEIRQSGDEVSISAPMEQSFEEGDRVIVTHEGPVMESHPLQVHLLSIELTEE
ncbi:MAG: DUF3221 domain-containing protein [Alkalibacterium sp.]|nr:DUF3221 domain-containing protein [Alkalibacterium sp.]TVP90636.1 MAG: hypothetical protein EA249_07035 [Alkalibacterium sp.]